MFAYHQESLFLFCTEWGRAQQYIINKKNIYKLHNIGRSNIKQNIQMTTIKIVAKFSNPIHRVFGWSKEEQINRKFYYTP